jgi:hypothetical protein
MIHGTGYWLKRFWALGESRAGKSTLSLGTTLNRYLDNIDQANSNRDVSVWVRLKLADF